MGRTPTASAECGRNPFSARCVADCPAKYGAGDLGHDFHRCGNGRNSNALSRGLLLHRSVQTCEADHTEPPVLYSIIIAQPSERKSPVMHFIKAPFDTFESKYNKDHREEMYKAQQDVKALEARVKAMEKEDEPDTTAIAKLRVQADNIRNTTPIRIAVDDITTESLVIELSENDSLLMISDEAGMLSNFNGKYNGGIPPLLCTFYLTNTKYAPDTYDSSISIISLNPQSLFSRNPCPCVSRTNHVPFTLTTFAT